MSAEPTQVTNPEGWAQWQGQVVNGVFPLRRLLGAANDSAVFLTEHKAKNLADAAIKFVPADALRAEAQLAQWSTIARLSHPHLIGLFGAGRCQLGGRDYLFVVMEHAEQTLAQILRHRALSADEAREILFPALDVLAFLQRNQLVHGQLKPSNFLAVNDQLKLASDTVRPAGNSVRGEARTSPYDPPELKDRGYSIAGDVWGLGMTLLEALTQRTTAWPDETVSLPATMPAPFGSTVRRCLSLSPAIRPTVTDLESQYKPVSAAPSIVTPAPVPVSVPSAAIAPVPAAAPVPVAATAPVAAAAVAAPVAAPAPAAAVAVAVVAPAPVPAAATASVPVAAPVPSAAPARAAALPPAQPSPLEANTPPSPPKRRLLLPAIAVALLISLVVWIGSNFSGTSEAPVQPGGVPVPTPAPVAPPTIAKPDAALPRPASRSSKPPSSPPTATSADVLHQVIPDVPRKISNKITGRVLVTVRVLVDPAGNVIGTLMENPGPSKYFARLADKAAAEWKFVPTDKQASRVWLVRFAFSRNGITTRTTAVP